MTVGLTYLDAFYWRKDSVVRTDLPLSKCDNVTRSFHSIYCLWRQMDFKSFHIIALLNILKP